MLSLVGRVASASASGALRGLSPSAALPQAQLLLRAAPAGVHPGKRLPGGASSVLLPVTLSLGLSDPFSIRIPGQRTTVQPRSARTVARGSVDITSSVPFCEARVAGSCLDLEVLRGDTKLENNGGSVHEVGKTVRVGSRLQRALLHASSYLAGDLVWAQLTFPRGINLGFG